MGEEQDGHRRDRYERRGPAAQLTTEPEHDHETSHDRRIVRDLSGRDRPERAAEPACTTTRASGAGRYHQAEHHRAEQRRQHGEMAADEQQVTPTPPRRQQPEADHESGEPEGPEDGPEVLRLQGWQEASSTIRVTRQRKTFGRTITLRFRESAHSNATGNAA